MSTTKTLFKGGTLWQHGVADLLIEGNKIVSVAKEIIAEPGTLVKDVSGHFIYPGFINTHHHLTQSLAKAVPAGINSDLNHWLGAVPFALWDKITPEVFYHSAVLGFYELIRSGSTTCADHFYIYHQDFNQELEDALYQAASDTGIRFVHCRGGATHSGSHRGTKSTSMEPESVDLFLSRLGKTRKQHHDASESSMSRLVAAPTSIVHTSPPSDLREISSYAREHQLRMHSHLLEVTFDEEAALKHYELRAIDYAASADWLGDDVWFAHLVHADSYAIDLMAQTGTGIAHCPMSNCRLGSGVASVPAMHQKGMPVSIGVDGSASSESGSMINELMLSWLVHRSVNGAQATDVDTVMEWATTGGAKVLGFEKLGKLEPGMLADFSIIDLNQPRFWGLWEKQWAPVVCGEPIQVEEVYINGKSVYSDNSLRDIDILSLQSKVSESLIKLMS